MSGGLGGFAGMLPRKRRVFFSFHYQKDVWRANQIRQSWRFQNESTREAEGFFDGSLWESSQRQSDDSLKELIRGGLNNTTVTCVLAGTYTGSRRWVRYEIAQSVVRNNGLVTVKIHEMQNQQQQSCLEGSDPLALMGVYKVSDGRILLAEFTNGQWVRYGDYTLAVSLPANWTAPTTTDVIPLSAYAHCHFYVRDSGYQNFASWVSVAAANAGR